MNNPQLSIIIPAYNEEENISTTLESLIGQFDQEGNPLNKNCFQIVVVDNGSSDKTANIVKNLQKTNAKPEIHLIREPSKGVIAARIAGYNFVIKNQKITSEFLASGDADITFHPKWVYEILKTFKKEGADVISNAGCFHHDFWVRVPNLAQRYLEEIGTIFFNPETIDWLNVKGKRFLFTEQIFWDFMRPVTDGCFAIRKETYLKAGGYTREFLDGQKTQEVYGEGWRLVFKLERMDTKIIYLNKAPYSSSPRRLLEEPKKFLGNQSYEGQMADLRGRDMDLYQRLNELSKKISLEEVKRYIVEYYILLKCITRPPLIRQNIHYFGYLAEEIEERIKNFWLEEENREGKELFTLSRNLVNDYFERLLETIPRQLVK